MKRHPPEIIQTSRLDCGPAALKSVLAGFGIHAHYGRLREACRTSVDGTSINDLAGTAAALGLKAKQVLLPDDILLSSQGQVLPAIVTVRLPDDALHFVVLWRLRGQSVLMMDPAEGLHWISLQDLRQRLYIHTSPLSVEKWLAWARGGQVQRTLQAHLRRLGIAAADQQTYLQTTQQAPWHYTAALLALCRLLSRLRAANAIPARKIAASLSALLPKAIQEAQSIDPPTLIPLDFWSVRPHPTDSQRVLASGAVCVSISGTRYTHNGASQKSTAQQTEQQTAQQEEYDSLPTELQQALQQEDESPWGRVWQWLQDQDQTQRRASGRWALFALAAAAILTTVLIAVEMIATVSLLDASSTLFLPWQKWELVGALIVLSITLLLLEWAYQLLLNRTGRQLEGNLRAALLQKLPRLPDPYFSTRPLSDLADRAHQLDLIRQIPSAILQLLQASTQLIVTFGVLAWLMPAQIPFLLLSFLVLSSSNVLLGRTLTDVSMRLLTYNGALMRFLLDALLGAIPIRTHSAQGALRSEQESLLVPWYRAAMRKQNLYLAISTIENLLSNGIGVWLTWQYLQQGAHSHNLHNTHDLHNLQNIQGIVFFFFWLPRVNSSTVGFTTALLSFPRLRAILLRLFEPLEIPEESSRKQTQHTKQTEPEHTKQTFDHLQDYIPPDNKGPVSITMRDVSVHMGGQDILHDLHLHIAAGEHIAIVGPSGAGKSSFVGLLLGWYTPTSGAIVLDAQDPQKSSASENLQDLQDLRQHIAWIDPSVQIWNRSLLENLRYGTHENTQANLHTNSNTQAQISTQISMNTVLQNADLLGLLERLPAGMQTSLGEGGCLLSGGEGQRVRLGRALHNTSQATRLVILDEAFRGLDRSKREELLQTARNHWQKSTLLCITHDISSTLGFSRVLVIDKGTIQEDGAPQELLQNPESLYRKLLLTEHEVQRTIWQSTQWRQLWVKDGLVSEIVPESTKNTKNTENTENTKRTGTGVTT